MNWEDKLIACNSKSAVLSRAAVELKNADSALYLLKIAASEDSKLSFRAAWLLEHMYFMNPEIMRDLWPEFKVVIFSIENPSVLRLVFKILSNYIHPKRSKIILHLEPRLFNDWLDYFRVLLYNEEIPVAVKSHILDIIAHLCTRAPELKETLIEDILFLQERHSIAFFAKAKKVLQQLRRL